MEIHGGKSGLMTWKARVVFFEGDYQLSKIDLLRAAWFKPGQDLSFELESLILREKLFSITEKTPKEKSNYIMGKVKRLQYFAGKYFSNVGKLYLDSWVIFLK